MADASAVYSVDLEDNTSGTAERAAGALRKLKGEIDADTRALADMQKAMRNLQGGASVNIEQFRALKAQIDAKKASIAQAQSSYMQLGGTFGGVKRAGKPAIDTFAQLAEQAKGMPGPLAGVVGRLGSLKAALAGGAIALGIAAIAAAMALLVAGAVAATAALLRYGIASANARRSELLRLEGLTKMRNWWGIAAGNAGEMQSAIDRVSASSALGRDKIAEYSAQLYKLHLRGENLTLALEAMAIKGAAQGDEAAKHFAGWAAGAAFAGQSVKRLADDVKARLGGVAAAQMLDLDVQAAKLRESYTALFAGLKVEGLLKAVNAVTALFSQSTASGRALKAMVSTVFQPMINALEYLGPITKRFFQGMIIGALMIGIAVLRVRNWFRKTFGDVEVLKGIDTQTLALKAGLAVVAGLAGLFVVLAGTIGLVLAPFALLAGWIAAVGLVARGVYRVFTGIEWSKLGKSIVDGIVGGLKSGAKWVIDAVKNLGGAAWSAFRSKLGIASPSKEFARLGLALPEGVQQGIEDGTPGARRAAETMIPGPRIPDAAAPAAAASGARAGGTGATVNVSIGDLHVHTTAKDAPGIVGDLRAELVRMLEGVAIELGAPLPGGA